MLESCNALQVPMRLQLSFDIGFASRQALVTTSVGVGAPLGVYAGFKGPLAARELPWKNWYGFFVSSSLFAV